MSSRVVIVTGANTGENCIRAASNHGTTDPLVLQWHRLVVVPPTYLHLVVRAIAATSPSSILLHRNILVYQLQGTSLRGRNSPPATLAHQGVP